MVRSSLFNFFICVYDWLSEVNKGLPTIREILLVNSFNLFASMVRGIGTANITEYVTIWLPAHT